MSCPILGTSPTGAVRVTGPEDVVPTAGVVVVDVAWEGPDSSSTLARTCNHVFDVVGREAEVHLALPGDLAGIDFQPPAGRWAGVIAPRPDDWGSRLLAARLTGAGDGGDD